MKLDYIMYSTQESQLYMSVQVASDDAISKHNDNYVCVCVTTQCTSHTCYMMQ